MNKKVKNDRLASNGFHVHYLPYADDIRQLPKNDTVRAQNDEVELFKNVVRGLKFKYRPDKFENPALQTLWRSIEAAALNKSEPEEFIDLTIPCVENQNRKAAAFVDELKQMIFPPGYVMGSTKKLSAAAKRKVCSSSSSLASSHLRKVISGRRNVLDTGHNLFSAKEPINYVSAVLFSDSIEQDNEV